MRKILFFILIAISIVELRAQKNDDLTKKSDEIMKEAFKLYYREKAACIGTDLLNESLSKIPESKNLKGYLAYENNGKYSCIFYDNSKTANVLVEYIFDKTFDPAAITVKLQKRVCNKNEVALISIRNEVLKVIQEDSFF